MNRFNLTFWGEILPGKDPEQVKARFARLFDITDPERLEHFFTGETIILRRNLDRKVAGEYYHKLHKLGVEAELVKVTGEVPLAEPASNSNNTESDWEIARQQAEREALQRRNREAQQRKEASNQAAEKKRQAEEAAQRKAEQEAERKRSAEEAARHKAEQAAEKKRQAEEAAQRKAEQEAERKRSAEEAARRKAEQAAEKKRQAEEAAQRKAEQEAERKRRAEEAARRKAEQAAEKKRQAEEAAKRKAEQEAERKRRAEEAARHKAEQAAEKKRQAEEAAKRKAEQEAERKLRAEEAARHKAEQAAEKERQAEEAAKRKAEQEAERKRRAEEAARRKAEQAAEKKRQAEEAARIKAEKQAEKQRKAEAAARKKAAEQEKRRRAAEAAAKEKAAAEAQRKQREAEQKEIRRRQREAELAEQARQEQARHRAEEEALRRERELEERAIERGARALAESNAIKATQASVRSRLELPRRNTAYHSGKASHSPAAPNLYRLRPFRNTAQVRERPAIARQKMRKGLLTGITALALLLILLGRFVSLTPPGNVEGPSAVAASSAGELVILAGNELLLHDRAGVSRESIVARDLGLTALSPPLAYTPSGDLLLSAKSLEHSSAQPQLWQCQLDERLCTPIAPALAPDALTVHPLTGELFVANMAGQALAKLAAGGELMADAARPIADHPVLRLDAGLLFVNGSDGPAVSVLRYEDQAFGQQLDEILLLPPAALEAEQTRVWDFATSGSHWWVTLYNPGSGDSGLYLFDANWTFIRQLPGSLPGSPGQLLNWGNKILQYHPQQAQILRFSATGNAEVPLLSDSLQRMIDSRAAERRLGNAAWSVVLILLTGTVIASLAFAYLQASRALVYKSRPARGAAPLDDIADDIHWVNAVAARKQQLRHANVGVAVLSLAVIIVLIGLGVSLATLVGAMLALCGPVVALQLLLRSEREYLGTWDDHLVVVDHRQLYQLASGARIQYRGPFLLIDDVVIFTGTPLLPAMDGKSINQEVAPLARAGVRVDRKTVLVKLLESRHPVARAGQAVGFCLASGLLVMILGQLPWQG
ncbi:hypothetical protein [Seongchinamella unica]|uniref:hypothetical protein n=1 Tax=Seongchinamella unica TaxID=2547392 RepID=UPI00140492A0|nr:hypothetical protein [Seongchinamella unica]